MHNLPPTVTMTPQMVGQIPILIPNPSSPSTDAVVHPPRRRL
jgi:hypothetical protein